jgi:hypothetical protein
MLSITSSTIKSARRVPEGKFFTGKKLKITRFKEFCTQVELNNDEDQDDSSQGTNRKRTNSAIRTTTNQA